MLGPNTCAWPEQEIKEWLASRPHATTRKPKTEGAAATITAKPRKVDPRQIDLEEAIAAKAETAAE